MKTFSDLLKSVELILLGDSIQARSSQAKAEAEQIVIAWIRKSVGETWSRMDLLTQANCLVPSAFPLESLWDLASARARGEPFQYLTGYQAFLDHEYQVGPGVLIPRPETEVLLRTAEIDLAGQLGGRPEDHPKDYQDPIREARTPLGLEVGLGSGVLSIELLSRFPSLRMIASELSDRAQDYAFTNARTLLGTDPKAIESRLKVVSALHSREVLEPFQRIQPKPCAHFLIMNPPYLLSTDPGEFESQVLVYEPGEALFAPDEDPLYFYRCVAEGAGSLFASSGTVYAEVPHERAALIAELFIRLNWEVNLFQDLTQRPRVLTAKWKVKTVA